MLKINRPLIQDLDDSLDSLVTAGIVQQLTRTLVDATDQITGIFRCDFESGQQRYALNIPIHPALPGIPSVEAIVLDGDARIRVTDRQKYGVRLELVLNSVATAELKTFVDVVIASNILPR